MNCRYCNSSWESSIQPDKCPFCGHAMNDENLGFTTIESVLSYIVKKRGISILDNPQLLVALMSDLAPEFVSERRLLKVCADAGIFKRLTDSNLRTEEEKNNLIDVLANALNTNYFIDNAAAKSALLWISNGALDWNLQDYVPEQESACATGKNNNDPIEVTDHWEQYKIGYNYEFGVGITQNYEKAVEWYKKSAAQGNAWSQNRLGDSYYHGHGVKKDFVEAVKWYQKSAEEGNDFTAQFNLGICYYFGNGVSKDFSKAAGWLKRSAEQGQACAQNWLGYLYEHGYGVQKDYTEAAHWYKKSAEQNYPDGLKNYGLCYYYGNGVSKDLTTARRLLEQASELGNEDAKKKLETF